ncbi:acyltransferase [Methylobacterium sp. E-066]|uniref:acyltransferase family protein n=1 Tax=Methylobacterium sp. E-066 TaxID=2836584 RepID=UPI002443BA34|nr:acyltransferase [Methylobacterium sp. E-066]
MVPRVRYEILDGLRGVAAVGVMLFHLSIIDLPLAPHGYLAVDFFFVLSGFVLSHAYAGRLSAMPLGDFMRLRLIRMLPLSVLGVFVGSLYFLMRFYVQNYSQYGLADITIGTLFNAALLPKPWTSSAPTDTIFTTNTPLWSLSLEMLMNIVWAAFFYRARSSILLLLVLVSAISITVLAIENGSADIGATWPTYPGGLARVGFGFFIGVVLWRYRPEPDRGGFLPEIAAVLLIAVLFVPDIGPEFDIFAILVVLPAIIYLAACSDYRKERALFRVAGALSYPLYAIHVPILQFMVGFMKILHLEDRRAFVAMLAVLVCIGIAYALDRLYDRPVRRLLTQAFVR